MEDRLCCEKTSSDVISTLPVWIIEYAWTHRMMEVLEVLGPPLWLEGDRSSLSLKDVCSIRVTAAESWMVIRARDIEHFEQVMEFLDTTHTLLPQLVTPIKHMKIMFGLKTLVIMWMLWDEQNIESITDKIESFFSDSLLQYYRSSHRHMELMQKAQRDFRKFAQLLTRNPEMRKHYVRNLMEEQYGERYTVKLEERLFHYLEELNKALRQPTYIDQILKQSGPLKGREEFLQQLFTCNSAPPATALKKLLRCAMASHKEHKSTKKWKQCKGAQGDGPVSVANCVALKSSLEEVEEDWLSQTSSQSSWVNRNKNFEQQRTKLKKHVLDQAHKLPCVLKEWCPQMTETRLAEESKAQDDLPEHLCSRHGKRMRSILQECSEELRGQDEDASLMQVECTPLSPEPPLFQSTPDRLPSASSLDDSSSTNISPSSQPEPFSYRTGDEERQVVLLQPMASSQRSPVQESNSGQKSNITLMLQLSSSQALSVQLTTSSSPCTSSHSASSSTNISHFSANKFTQKLPWNEEEYSPGRSFEKMCPESSYHQSSLSSSPSMSSSSAAPAATVTPCQNDAQVILESSKPRLSLETQSFLMVSKWLQPRVKLCRLSQQQCHQATLPNSVPEQSSEEERVDKEEASFDLNLLYSDSESDTQDSNDSDYIPPKRWRYR